jgi:hypothetical protein
MYQAAVMEVLKWRRGKSPGIPAPVAEEDFNFNNRSPGVSY